MGKWAKMSVGMFWPSLKQTGYKASLETLIPTCVCADESLKAVNFTNKKKQIVVK